MLTSSDSHCSGNHRDHLLLLAGRSGSVHRDFSQSAPGRLANIIHGDRRKACTGCAAGHADQQGHSKVVTAYRLELHGFSALGGSATSASDTVCTGVLLS